MTKTRLKNLFNPIKKFSDGVKAAGVSKNKFFHNIFVTLSALAGLIFIAGCKENIKEPAVAGTFYPSDAKALSEMVHGFLSTAEDKQHEGKLIALLSPHAGYRFSGQVAAHCYKQLAGKEISTVILVGPSHHVSFKGVSVYAKGKMRTPLGDVKIDENLAGSLINEKAEIAFYPQAFEKEHSLEVQLPFLQRTLKNFKIVPLLIGSPTRESFAFLTERLTDILRKNEGAIIIASTDLSHYHDYKTAVSMDSKVIDSIERMSIEDVERNLIGNESELCGEYPVMLTMAVAGNLGATNSLLYKYANSGDVTGDKDHVVGYAAIGIYKSPLTNDEKALLLKLARKTIIDYVTRGKISDSDVKNPRLKANCATFVTINRNGNLRGCIGNLKPVLSLYKSVAMNAVSASSGDPRFPPMNKDELKDMEVEVSVLSVLEPLQDIKHIVLGRHGLLLVKGQSSGVFLPKVPVEFGWDINTYLENLSLKAGLPKDSWKDARLYTFTAEVVK